MVRSTLITRFRLKAEQVTKYGRSQQPKLPQHVRYPFIALAQEAKGFVEGIQALVVMGLLVFDCFYSVLNGAEHRATVP